MENAAMKTHVHDFWVDMFLFLFYILQSVFKRKKLNN